MLHGRLLRGVLRDEGLTRNLGDEEARVLVEWLVDRAEELAAAHGAADAEAHVDTLRRRGRAIARFVSLWGSRRTRGAAAQLAATERFAWNLPDRDVEPCALMQHILCAETEHRSRRYAT